jgi:mono/diheme cytochrome c family protein
MKKICYLFLFTFACTNSKQDITPQCKAETTSKITYQDDVKAIIDKNCNSCHSNKSHSGGVKLEDLSDLQFWANSGELYDQIIPFGGNPPRMPKGMPLTDCEVLTIKKWIDGGMN